MAFGSLWHFGHDGVNPVIFFCALVALQSQMCLSSTITAASSSTQDLIARRQESSVTGNPGYPVLLGYSLGFDYTFTATYVYYITTASLTTVSQKYIGACMEGATTCILATTCNGATVLETDLLVTKSYFSACNGPPFPSIMDCQTVFIYGSYQTTDTAAQRYTYYDCGYLSAEITLYQTTPPGGAVNAVPTGSSPPSTSSSSSPNAASTPPPSVASSQSSFTSTGVTSSPTSSTGPSISTTSAASSTPSPATSSGTSNSTSIPSSSNSKSSAWIAGPVVGAVAGVLLLGLSLWIWRLYRVRDRVAAIPPSSGQAYILSGQKAELYAPDPPGELHASSLLVELPAAR